MQKLFLMFFIGASQALFSQELVLNITTPIHKIGTLSNGNAEIQISDYSLLGIPGKPNLPCRILFIAIPPGAEVKSIEATGELTDMGRYKIEPALPILPKIHKPEITERIGREFEITKEMAYLSDELYPERIGELVSEGSFRKYRFVVVALYPFAYRAGSKKLYYAKDIRLRISYIQNPELIDPSLLLDGSVDKEASQLFYNWDQAREWYRQESLKTATGYLIIAPSSLISAVDVLKTWKTQQGYKVEVITKEWIDGNISGVDLSQKIRNYLRSRLTEISYVLIVGSDDLIPMRRCCPWPNDPDGPNNWHWQSPVPTDLYYADLSSPDSLSWDRDGDGLYGERGEDRPDFTADVAVGRIPFNSTTAISHICEKTKKFEQDTIASYKKSSLLAGGILWYDNEDGQGPGFDGAVLMEKLMDDGIIDRSLATTLYEKEGLLPSIYDCDYPDTRENIISQWKKKGIFIEIHHGFEDQFVRKVWTEDDGDEIPEEEGNEMSYPLALRSTDANQLDDDYPAVGFLGSCLNGYPENMRNLGAFLLYHGSAGMVASSRIAYGRRGWEDPTDGGQDSYLYYFCEELLKDASVQIGEALNNARFWYMRQGGGFSWGYTGYAMGYAHNLYGDPALFHFGAPPVAVAEDFNPSSISLQMRSNPFVKKMKVSYDLPMQKRVTIRVFDIKGSLVKTLIDEIEQKGSHTVVWQGDNDKGEKVSTGVYFLEFNTIGNSFTKKIIFLE